MQAPTSIAGPRANLAEQVYTTLKAELHDFLWVAGDRYSETEIGQRLADPRAVGELDEGFHATLVSAAGNAGIARVHQEVTDRIRIVRRLDFTRADRIDATYQEHAKILRAVIQRKGDQAQLLLKSHIEQGKTEVRKITLHTLHEARRRAPR